MTIPICPFVVTALVTLAVWMIAMWIMRYRNFEADGSRKPESPNYEKGQCASQIQYHNEATYKAMEFYMKVFIAVAGGIAYLVVSKPVNIEAVRLLIRSGGWIILLVSCLFSIATLVHQKSKIERWERRPVLFSPLLWNETWFVVFAMTVGVGSQSIVGVLLG